MGEVVDSLVKTYRFIASFPSVTSGFILKSNIGEDGVRIISGWSQRNLECGTTTKFQRLHFLNASYNSQKFPPTDISSQLLTSYSVSGKYTAVVRSVAGENSKKKQYLEVWDGCSMVKNFDISAYDVHGDIYTDGEFGCLTWSPDESKLAYVAEKKLQKTEPFYKPKNPTQKEKKAEEETPLRGGEYYAKPDWGEQLVGKHQPVVAVCDIVTEKISLVEGVPDHFSPGQLIWNNTGDGLFGVALENEPRRLGLIYCSNRLSVIFQLSLTDGNFKVVSEEGVSVRSPRLTPDGKLLFYLMSPVGGPHAACQKLIKVDLSNNTRTTVVGVIKSFIKIASDQLFYGIYSLRLPNRCFSKDSSKLLFSTPQQLYIKSYFLDIATGVLTEIQDNNSLQILDVYDDKILCGTSSVTSPATLKLTSLPIVPGEAKWIVITEPKLVVENTVVRHLESLATNSKDSFRSFNSIYFGPKASSGQKIPLIVFPHGGPHSVYSNQYMFDPAYLVSVGFAVLMVNYRGSLGNGQDSIDFLPSRVGDTDVKDVHQACQEVLNEIKEIDPEKVVLYGGSHGGFLISHLSGQYPDFYKAVSNRNGVVDVAAMYTISDIPDWCSVESGQPYNQTTPLSTAAVTKMYNVSPICFVDKIKAPTLIFIGQKDLRVPSSQGVYLYNTLKARNIKARLVIYDDNHPLGLVPNEIDHVLNTTLWFREALQIELLNSVPTQVVFQLKLS